MRLAADPSPDTYAYQRIASSLLAMIDAGALAVGDRLPSVRHICRTQRVSPATAMQAFAELERQGRVAVRDRSGHYVLPVAAPRSQPVMAPPDPEPTRVGVSNAVASVFQSASDRRLVPLGATVPDPRLLPGAELARYLGAAGRSDVGTLTRYAFEPALPALARELSRRYAAAGCLVPPEDFTITCGGMEALNLAIRAVTRPGDVVAVESPGYFGLLEILESLGLQALPVPTTCDQGVDLDALRSALDDFPVKAVVLVTAFSNPTGASLSDAKRAALVDLLDDYGIPLIEDDIYGELAFDGHRPRPVRSWDRRGQVLLCGSFSKSLCPGLRLGWVAGGAFTERIRRLKLINTVNTPATVQAAIATFLADNRLDRHLRRFRRAIHRHVWNTRQAVLEHFPAGSVPSNPQGGYFLWVQLPAGVDASAVCQDAREQRIAIAPGHIFCATGNYGNFLRLSCGVVWSTQVASAVATLGGIVRDHGRKALRVPDRRKRSAGSA